MSRKILFAALIVLILSSSVAFLVSLAVQRALDFAPTIDQATAQKMLAATVRITLYAPLLDDNGQAVIIDNGSEKQIALQVGEGLGTAATVDGQSVIVTHDHWSLLTDNLYKAQFHNAAGELLMEMRGADFLELIRHQDGGTIVLDFPAELAGTVRPVQAGRDQAIKRGDTVFIVYRQPDGNGLGVATMVVTTTEDFDGRASLRLRSAEGKTVVSGNSGGGVWHEGQLVANMWTTVYQEWSSGAVRSSELSRAAQFPLDFQLGL